MEDSRKKRIEELKERIFLLQIEERRFWAVAARPTKHEELKAQAKKGLKDTRDMPATLTKELVSLQSESSKP